MNRKLSTLFIAAACLIFVGCGNHKENLQSMHLRKLVDTVGFAHLGWQVDSVMSRINHLQAAELKNATQNNDKPWRVAICPHDDHTYVGWQ